MSALTLKDFREASELHQKWWDAWGEHATAYVSEFTAPELRAVRTSLKADALSAWDALPGISLKLLRERNAPLVSVTPEQAASVARGGRLRMREGHPVDRALAASFPIIGSGSEALVFDAGTCVLKSRISDTWHGFELSYQINYARIPGMIAESRSVHLKDYPPCWVGDGCAEGPELEAQAKLRPVSVEEVEADVRRLYFPAKSADFDDFKFWEWGVDEDGVPRVLDWG